MNINTLHQAIMYVHQLPYGRTSDRTNYISVLKGGLGACSSKHALIAALASELGIPIQLKLGIFMMNAVVLPAVAGVLNQHCLNELPEAHCYLQYDQNCFDITFPSNCSGELSYEIIEEMVIQPNDIGEFKIRWHQQFIKRWLIKQKNGYNLEDIWSIREACIFALA